MRSSDTSCAPCTEEDARFEPVGHKDLVPGAFQAGPSRTKHKDRPFAFVLSEKDRPPSAHAAMSAPHSDYDTLYCSDSWDEMTAWMKAFESVGSNSLGDPTNDDGAKQSDIIRTRRAELAEEQKQISAREAIALEELLGSEESRLEEETRGVTAHQVQVHTIEQELVELQSNLPQSEARLNELGLAETDAEAVYVKHATQLIDAKAAKSEGDSMSTTSIHEGAKGIRGVHLSRFMKSSPRSPHPGVESAKGPTVASTRSRTGREAPPAPEDEDGSDDDSLDGWEVWCLRPPPQTQSVLGSLVGVRRLL